MVDRRHRELEDRDIKKIAETYHNWRNEDGIYEDVQGFCKAAKIEDVREHEYVLTPGRYVGVTEEDDDGIPFEEKMEILTSELGELFAKSNRLENEIRKNLGGLDMSFKISEICEINKNNITKRDELKHIYYLDTANLTEGIISELKYLEVGKDKIPSRAKRKVFKKIL